MKRLSALAVILALFSLGCDSDSPTSPTGPPTTVRFTAQLTPANEVPPVTNADASATGTSTITLNLTRDAGGAITSATADFTTSVTGFITGTVVTAGHIHRAAAGTNAGVLVGQFAAGEFSLNAGAGTLTRNTISVSATDAQGMLDNPAGHYFNVHTSLNPGGAIRGQLTRQP